MLASCQSDFTTVVTTIISHWMPSLLPPCWTCRSSWPTESFLKQKLLNHEARRGEASPQTWQQTSHFVLLDCMQAHIQNQSLFFRFCATGNILIPTTASKGALGWQSGLVLQALHACRNESGSYSSVWLCKSTSTSVYCVKWSKGRWIASSSAIKMPLSNSYNSKRIS